MRIQGFPVKRFPRWDTRPLTPEESAEMRAALDRVGALTPARTA